MTTTMTARLLLGHQLQVLDEVSWTVVTGDAYEAAPPNLDVEVVPMRREFAPSDIVAFVGLWRYFRRRRFDFVQTHTPKASFLGLPAARLGGTTAIYTIHGALYFRDNGRVANVMGWVFERWCCAWADLVLVQSREDFDVLPNARVCNPRKIRFLGNGVVLDHFTTPVAPEASPSSPPGEPAPKVPTVLMVSRLVREKGCADFLGLARSLRGRATFVHVGPVEHDQRDALSDAEIAAATDDVTFVGAVDDIRPFLSEADVVVQPSYREGVPRVAIEAAVAGRPVVGYDVRGVREVIDPTSGLLVPRGDTVALLETVQRLLDDPQRRVALGESCRRRVVERFSEDDVITRLRAVYAELTGPRGARGTRASMPPPPPD
ncbi:MAG TPA: glycosyltransferase [Acidimicrobiales bacterium]|nr:glycosyltransferase [Acidimicrobiales bacterium]